VTSSAARLVRHEHQLVGVARDLLKRLEVFLRDDVLYGPCRRKQHGQTRIGLTDADLLQKMLEMKKVTSISIRELQQNLKQVMGRVAHGQVFEVTRHRQPIARLIPMRPIGPVSPWPDLDARAHNVFGRRRVSPGASQIVIDDRGER